MGYAMECLKKELTGKKIELKAFSHDTQRVRRIRLEIDDLENTIFKINSSE